MKQVLILNGNVVVDAVPAPVIAEGNILVETAYSLISAGTETSSLENARKSLWKKALEHPEHVRKVLDYFKSRGISKTVNAVKSELQGSKALGYSCSGVVVGVGDGVSGFKVGDPVACAGGGKANHAEVVLVPENLAVKIPEGCGLRDAASVTMGAIAMQGVRRAAPELGEIFAVIGLGLLGLITVQLLKAAGCRVIALDLDEERVELARELGADYSFLNSGKSLNADIANITGGHGVDATILTAASESSEIVQQAMELTRKKGRVVVVGVIGLGLRRSPFYRKEIDFLISCSYGPGRYDQAYEEKGVDYPYPYVRWTEKRNMEEYLRLVAAGRIQLNELLEREYPVTDAPQAYEELIREGEKPVGALLAYGTVEGKDADKFTGKIVLTGLKNGSGKINVAVVGAGSFARAVHLPNLKKLDRLYHIAAIVGRTGNSAKDIANKYGVGCCATDFEEVLNDPGIDMVLIATRHNLHVRMATAAARAGKAIYLEKPMALNREELVELVAVLEETGVPFTVGFNRRFSPAAREIRKIVKERVNPLIVNYRMNAGFVPKDHWVNTKEGGGRNIGEACHIYDLFSYFTGSEVKAVSASSISPGTEKYLRNDNFVATVEYADGSVCNLIYTALGAKEVPKEQLEIYMDGRIISLNDYRELRITGPGGRIVHFKGQDKGHFSQLEKFGERLKAGGEYIIPLRQLVQTTEVSLNVEGMIGK